MVLKRPLDRSEITAFAAATRERLEPVWANDPERSDWPNTPLSYLQCRDSLAFLLEGLVDVDATVTRYHGRVEFAPEHHLETIDPHSWLGLSTPDQEKLTLDITGDQHGLEAARVVCATEAELALLGMHYQAQLAWELRFDGNLWQATRAPL